MVLEVVGLKTYYRTLGGFVKAVDDISFELPEGEALGLVGESACGKSTAALSLMRLLPPEGKIIAGEVYLQGDDVLRKKESEMRQIRWKKISMIFQSAMNALNPVFRIEDQIVEAILTHEQVSKSEALERTKKLIEKVGMDQSILRSYPHELSGGMKQRVVIAMALASNPKIVLADEPTTALDVIVQAQILKLIKDIQKDEHLSVVLITHDLSVIVQMCDTIAVMYAGKIVERGSTQIIIKDPKHPYTMGMLSSFPSLSRSRYDRLTFIPGTPPNLVDPPSGCRFHPRCPHAMDVCIKKEPKNIELDKGHPVACHLYI